MREGLRLIILMVAIFALVPTIFALNDCAGSTSICYGSSLASPLGYGAVELCDDCYVCGLLDGICPEDYNDGTLRTNCSRCADPDCEVRLSGYVFAEGTSNPVPSSTVTAVINHISSTSYSDNADLSGRYSIDPIPRGFYQLKVQAPGYDTRLVDFPINQGDYLPEYELNISLKNGTCHVDCTGTHYEGETPRCDRACEGYTSNGQTCHFNQGPFMGVTYYADEACDGVPVGNSVVVAHNNITDTSFVVDCCTGTFHQQTRPRTEISQEKKVKNMVDFKTAMKVSGIDGITYVHIVTYST